MPPSRRRNVAIAVPKDMLDEFRRIARKTWPNEAYGILFGRRKGDIIIIEDIYYPTTWEAHTDKANVHVTEGMWAEAQIAADWQSTEIIGDIHSHPYDWTDSDATNGQEKDTAPSRDDWERFNENYLQGIVTANRTKSGRIYTRCQFWLPGPITTTVVCK